MGESNLKQIKKSLLKLTLIIGLLFICYNTSNAQPVINFESVIYDYGKIIEEDGVQTAIFSFTNVGDKPLQITSVKASCGCTASNYTKEDVLPGEKGMVEAKYNPKNRPGAFVKNLTVNTNDTTQKNIILRIKGDVIPKPINKADNYPNSLGNLRFKLNNFAFDKVLNTEVKTSKFDVYNQSKYAMTIKDVIAPEHIKVHNLPITISPEQDVIIVLSYDAKMNNDYGFTFDKITLITDDTEYQEKAIHVSANIVYDFSYLTESDLPNAPKIVFETMEYDFGTIKTGDIVEFEFVFKNEGKSVLNILKTKASCGCTASAPSISKLKKGQKSKINVKFNSTGKAGKQNYNITVYSNDPSNPIIHLQIKGEVVK